MTEKKKYLAQLHNISPDYAEGVYRRLKDPKFTVDEVKELSKDAHTWGKERKFMPSTGEKLSGFAPTGPVYNF
jgi:catalase